jgi:O-6-methylguanine DNA methyltransferase
MLGFEVRVLQSPVGELKAVASERGLAALEFLAPGRQEMLHRRLGSSPKGPQISDQAKDHLAAAEHWLRAYFDARFGDLALPSLDLLGTPFEVAVWRELLSIPLGTTHTYAQIAAAVGSVARAVGNAVGRNPLAIVVPCHRVVGADGSLTGYGGGLEIKRRLLEHEGALARTLFD